jgi:hypothetical protein
VFPSLVYDGMPLCTMVGRSAGSAYPHAPDLGALLQILPGEPALVLGLELVVQRLGVVVVDELKTGA